MNTAMWEAFRTLNARARLTLATGAAAEGEVLAFSVDEGADSPLLPGAVLSARYVLPLAPKAATVWMRTTITSSCPA